ncbi:MAG: DUF1501 domain-containing protein [Pirellulaceae bacterium]
MLRLTDSSPPRHAGRFTRRDFMQVGTLSAIGLTLPEYLVTEQRDDQRACILIFNVGGPGQMDTFDMKPNAPAEYRGPFRPIATRSSEFQVSELLPRHAQAADKFSLVRSCYHHGPAVHDAGWQLMQTGRCSAGEDPAPHVGALLAHARRNRDLPCHVVLPETMGRGGGNLPNGQSGGSLGADYDPLVYNPDAPYSHQTRNEARTSPDVGEIRVGAQRRIRDVVDETLARFEKRATSRPLPRSFETAYAQLASAAARSAFDLRLEPRRTRERYGASRFGRCCLLARRLIERGVPFVTINTFSSVFDQPTWDVHGTKPFTTFDELRREVAPMYDRAYGALIEDLSERGMLDRTLVCNLCEFGRTPRINASGGRDHWPRCYTVYFAGGGVQGGRAVGRSDKVGGEPLERPVEPASIVATILHSLGLDPTKYLAGPANEARVIDELFA